MHHAILVKRHCDSCRKNKLQMCNRDRVFDKESTSKSISTVILQKKLLGVAIPRRFLKETLALKIITSVKYMIKTCKRNLQLHISKVTFSDIISGVPKEILLFDTK